MPKSLGDLIAQEEAARQVDPSTSVRLMYHQALSDYQQLVERYRKIEFATLSGPEALRLDRARNDLHKRIKLLGRQLGKTEKTVFADILGCDRNLSDYGLPEFGLITRDELSENRMFDRMPGIDEDEVGGSDMGLDVKPRVQSDGRGEECQEVGDLRPEEIGLVFARHVSKAVKLPNPGVFRTRGNLMDMADRTTREAVRRAKRFAAGSGYRLLHYHSFAHEYVEDVYAIVVDKDNLDFAADQIKRSRSEYGIREQDMPREVVEMDWREHQTRIDTQLESRFGNLPTEVGRMLYDHEWRQANDPEYRRTDDEVGQELERILKSNNFKLVDGRVVRVLRKAKDRHEQERGMNEESKGSFRRR